MSVSGKNQEKIEVDGDSFDRIIDEIVGVTDESTNHDTTIEGQVIEKSSRNRIPDIKLRNNRIATGLKNVDVGETGSIIAPLYAEHSNAVENSKVEEINGNLQGRYIFTNSEVTDRVYGDSHAGKTFARYTDNLTVNGDIEVENDGSIFRSSNVPRVIGDKVSGGVLDNNSVGGLVVADDVEVNEFNENMTVVTPSRPRGSGLETSRKFENIGRYPSDDIWQNFKAEVKENSDDIWGIPILNPDDIRLSRDKAEDLHSSSSYDSEEEMYAAEFFAKEEMMQDILEEELDFDPENSMNEIGDRIDNLQAFGEMENRRYASLLNLTLKAQETEAEKLGEFGEVLDGRYKGVDREAKHELFDRLKNNDILDIANQVRYDLDKVLRDEIGELMTSQAGLPDVSNLKEDWEEWDTWSNGHTSLGGMLETVYEENREEVANLTYLAEFLGEELELDTEEWVAKQKEKRLANEEYEINRVEDIEKPLRDELEVKKRELTLKAMEKLKEYDTVPTLNNEYSFTPFLTSEKEERGFIEFTGDQEEWENFVENLSELPFERRKGSSYGVHRRLRSDQLSPDFFGMPILEPEIDEVESWEELQKIESKSQDDLYAEFSDVESNLEEISNELNNIRDYNFLAPRYKSQILSKLVEDTANEDDTKAKEVSDFGTALRGLEKHTREELFGILKTDTDKAVAAGEINKHGQEAEYSDGDSKFGNSIFDIAVNREYSFFVDNESERIEEMLDSRGELPEPDPFFEEESPYRDIVEELTTAESLEDGEESEYGKMSDQELADKLRRVRGLGEKLGFDYDGSNVFGMLKGKEGQRQNTDFEPDENEIKSLLADRREKLEEDVQNKLREYVRQRIQNLGFEAAVDEYEEATGQRTDELDNNEIAALKVRKRQGGRHTETIDKLLENQNEVYELEANQEWLEKHEFRKSDLIDPDLSGQTDGDYKRLEDAEYNSELRIEVESSNIQMDTEREKQQYWREVTDLLDKVGVEDQVEDIEEAEQLVNELEKPEDEQDYQELKDAVNNYRSVENRAGGIPDELTMRVADPMDTTRMGQGFGSCHDIDGGSYAWASISNAVDANKMVFYAEDEQGRERARVKAFITEDEELIYHNTGQYKDIDLDTTEYFKGYMERVSDELGLEMKHSSEARGWKQRTELLEAHDWYSNS